MKPFVTVVINSYQDQVSWLKEAIRSYLTQWDVKLQLIVSTVEGDSAIKIARKFDVECVISPEPGIYTQLNKALNFVKGDWFAYASGNDVALATKLIDEVTRCGSDKKVCYSSFHIVDERLKVTKTATWHSYSYQKHRQGNFVSDLALMRRDVLKEHKPFRLKYKNHAYWDFWLRVAEADPEAFVYNPKPEWMYRMSSFSQHTRRKKDPKWHAQNIADRNAMLADHGVPI